MKVILKPAGVLFVVASFATLAFIAVPKRVPEPGGATAPVPTAPTATLASKPTSTTDWSKARRILEPDVTGSNWHQLLTKGKMELKVVPAAVPDHPHARRIVVRTLGEHPWDLQLAHSLEVAFKKSTRVRLQFWARSKDSASLDAVVEQAASPYTKIATCHAKLTPQWQLFSQEWEQTADTPPGWAHIDFQVAYKLGELEITGVSLDATP